MVFGLRRYTDDGAMFHRYFRDGGRPRFRVHFIAGRVQRRLRVLGPAVISSCFWRLYLLGLMSRYFRHHLVLRRSAVYRAMILTSA